MKYINGMLLVCPRVCQAVYTHTTGSAAGHGWVTQIDQARRRTRAWAHQCIITNVLITTKFFKRIEVLATAATSFRAIARTAAFQNKQASKATVYQHFTHMQYGLCGVYAAVRRWQAPATGAAVWAQLLQGMPPQNASASQMPYLSQDGAPSCFKPPSHLRSRRCCSPGFGSSLQQFGRGQQCRAAANIAG